MILRNCLFTAFLLPLTACGGGGGPSSIADPAPSTAQVTIDTAAGVDATVDTQVVAVTLERNDGTQTANLLGAPRMVRLADPTGAPDGIALRNVPLGTYARLHLITAPGSTTATARDGSRSPVDLPGIDLDIGLETEVHHRGGQQWLALRHDGTVTLTGSGARRGWNPSLLCGSANGNPLPPVCVTVTGIQDVAVFGTIGGDVSQRVHIEFEDHNELFDDHGGRRSRAEFVAALQPGDEICVSGSVDAQGVLRARRGQHHGRTDNPRYLGRIAELDPLNRTFAMTVQAVTRRGGRQELPAPERVIVRAGNARIHHGGSFRNLTFGELAVDDLVKVTWTSRVGDVVIAREIEVTSRNGQPADPEVQGMVSEVDLTQNRIVVVPRRDDPLVLSGRALTRLEVTVLATTVLARQARQGGDRTPIGLDGIVPGQDRIWVRGTATGEATMDADWVRVRTD